MCATCVATGSAYVVPALVGLRVYAARGRSRRRSGDAESGSARATGRRSVPVVGRPAGR